MDPRYTDFGEVDFSALHPTIQNEIRNKSGTRFIQVGQCVRIWQSLGWGESSLVGYC